MIILLQAKIQSKILYNVMLKSESDLDVLFERKTCFETSFIVIHSQLKTQLLFKTFFFSPLPEVSEKIRKLKREDTMYI